MRRWILVVVLFLSLGFTGIGPSFADETKPQVKLTTSMGEIVLELDRTAAPKTVANFLAYVKAGFLAAVARGEAGSPLITRTATAATPGSASTGRR